ncbi:MAG: hypothetical protein JWQ22_3299 [Devosia sp.]|nr:hypothetical protein [Devosia sp.]
MATAKLMTVGALNASGSILGMNSMIARVAMVTTLAVTARMRRVRGFSVIAIIGLR